MQRVVQRSIDNQFFPVSPSTLAVGSTIPFDCYIKRYKGYVIVIKAGTTLTEELVEKMKRHQNFFVEHTEREPFNAYRREHVPGDDALVEVEDAGDLSVTELSEGLEKASDTKEKIEQLYRTGVSLLRRCFQATDETLPMEELKTFSAFLAAFIAEEEYRLEQFLQQMPASYTEVTHSVNVGVLSGIIGRVLHMSRRQLEDIVLAGLLHDIGKMRIPREILLKESGLEPDEFEKMEKHPVFSVEIARKNRIGSAQILSGIRHHHEKRDGNGYPDGLSGNRIPMMAQIIGVCDVFDALTTERTYRAAYSSFEALKLMKREMHDQLTVKYIDRLIMLLKSSGEQGRTGGREG
jgi:HD-GYP domain-containing protein (c-di-GMP phosphodiesterase class II)